MENSELHLIVLWQNARYKQDEILEDIKQNLEILECIDITWTPENVAKNFTRFYGVKLDSGSGKEKECGTGSFLLVTAMDKTPEYGFVETSRGHEWVNTNLFNLKERYRSWTKGGHKIHTTNSPKETDHDITLLLGVNYEDYLKNAPKSWNGEIRKLNRDVSGCNGWESLADLFYTLNATVNYVVLRGLDNGVNSQPDAMADIDIFCEEYQNVCFIVNGEPQINTERPHFLTKVGDKNLYFDIWNIENEYYDKNWSKKIIGTKVLKDGAYYPNDENAFYEFIYHCFLHKNIMKKDYYPKAKMLYENLFKEKPEKLKFDDYYYLLKDFMKKNGYNYLRPKDKTVYFNEDLIYPNGRIEWLKNNYFMQDVELYLVSEKSGAGCQYFKGKTKDKEEVFVKWGGFGDICKNEYKNMEVLYKNNSVNFLKPYYYKNDGKLKNIVMEFVDGQNLRDLVENNKLSDEQKQSAVKDLENIAKSLYEEKIVHRDILLRNFVLAKDGHLKLIDFQFANSFENYEEDPFIIENSHLIAKLGEEFALDSYVWDDCYSISKIIEMLGGESEWVNEHIGKMVINFVGSDTKLHYKNLAEKIFSVKNQGTFSRKRKVITIFGVKIKFKAIKK